MSRNQAPLNGYRNNRYQVLESREPNESSPVDGHLCRHPQTPNGQSVPACEELTMFIKEDRVCKESVRLNISPVLDSSLQFLCQLLPRHSLICFPSRLILNSAVCPIINVYQILLTGLMCEHYLYDAYVTSSCGPCQVIHGSEVADCLLRKNI